MKKTFFTLIAAVTILAACNSIQKTGTTDQQSASDLTATDSLTAYLSAPQTNITRDSVILIFTVKNTTTRQQNS